MWTDLSIRSEILSEVVRIQGGKRGGGMGWALSSGLFRMIVEWDRMVVVFIDSIINTIERIYVIN